MKWAIIRSKSKNQWVIFLFAYLFYAWDLSSCMSERYHPLCLRAFLLYYNLEQMDVTEYF